MSVKVLNRILVGEIRDSLVNGNTVDKVVEYFHKEVGVQKEILRDAAIDLLKEPDVAEKHKSVQDKIAADATKIPAAK